MNAEIVKKRIKAIRRELANQAIDCLIVTNPSDVTYATAFSGSDSWAIITKDERSPLSRGQASPRAGGGTRDGRRIFLLTDSRYTEQAQKECVGCKIVRRADSEPLTQAVTKLIRELKSIRIRNVRIEKSVSMACFEALQKNIKAKLKTANDIIESLRSIKDKSEVAAIHAASLIAAKALEKMMHQVRPGMTENELAGLLNLELRKFGAVNSFDTIIAFGPNASRPHHQPGKRSLKRNDTVLIDFGAKYKGYCCDITRCFTVGRPTAFYKRVCDVVEQAQTAAIKMVKAGVEISRIDAAAREVIAGNNLPVYGHGTGHGLGLEIHELPYIKAGTEGRLRAGEVITIEPGVYIPGKLGVRIEDDVLVTDDGCRILTRSCPHGVFRKRLS